jgi:tetratricopeptide (TPR) repeat protein
VARTATATVVAGENRVKLSRARARWLRGDNATALAELEDALTLIPGLAESLNLRALVRIAAGDLAGAASDAERAVSAQPANPLYLDTRAYAYLKLGHFDAAAGDYDRVLSDPRRDSYVASYLGRGVARSMLGRPAEARADLETGLRLLPDTEPDPQLADLEAAARQTLVSLPPGAGSPIPVSPSPVATPVVSLPPSADRGPRTVDGGQPA